MSEEKTYKIVDGDISDGYHTFDELYEHRYLLWITLLVSDGCPGNPYLKKDHYIGWDLLGVETEEGQLSYHVPIKYRIYYETFIKERDVEWDGHTSFDVIIRLQRWLGHV